MPIVHSREFNYAFPLNKQTNIGTAVTAAKITHALPCRTFSPFSKDTPDSVSDRTWYGKGHSHPTFWDPITKRFVISNREFSMTQLSALWAPSFVFGGKVSSNPDSAQASVFQHLLTFQGVDANVETLYTSMIERAGAEYQDVYSGVVINSFGLVGNRNDHVVLSYEGFARNKATNVAAMPALAASQSFFKILKGTFNFGASGAPANVSASVLSFSLNVSQNASPFWLPGSPSGQEDLIAKVLIGDQTVSGNLVVFLDSDIRDLFLNNTECEVEIILTGDEIGATGHFHTVTISIPHFKISAESFGEEGSTTAYTLTFDENSVLKSASDPFIEYSLKSDIVSTEILVAA